MNCQIAITATAMTPLFGSASRITDIEFCAWLGQAAPGDRLEYHRGLLVVDTADSIKSPLCAVDRERLRALANAAHRAFEADLVHLVQVRLGLDRFAYLAIARPKKRQRTASSPEAVGAAVLSAQLLEAA